MADPYISRKEARSSWRPYNALMSPGLKRAREPFRIRNAVTGILIASFAVGVWAYSISAVKQDVFDDVDEEARSLRSARIKSLEDQEAVRTLEKEATRGVVAVEPPIAPQVQEQTAPTLPIPSTSGGLATAGRGLLPMLLDQQFPRLLDPSSKTLVWGAPPVDRIGKMKDP
ncbi:predicted protein [Sparassis crispa]|uniref:Cytochrome c oxidase assembly factor 3 n=1 Tax=Sparassis crispa TaxID=139825 RepID=A0A401GC99_9APHY|nr:predicted protein [Sparassis crispa]GBE79818.1 predicted protein [Sparassis crispa]